MNLLEEYLKRNNSNIVSLSEKTGNSLSIVRNLNYRDFSKWNIENFKMLASFLGKDVIDVIDELKDLNHLLNNATKLGKYEIYNRRYIGSKRKILPTIYDLIEQHTEGSVFFDIFGGTGVVTDKMYDKYEKFIINDFLYSNEQIYHAFFGQETIDTVKLSAYKNKFNSLDYKITDENYFSMNFGGKFFSEKDAFLIGEIREHIETTTDLNSRERSVLIASLLYSADKISNTVGHYDAYRKRNNIRDKFEFDLVNAPISYGKEVEIYRKDANKLVSEIEADIAFIDPPYNSRQYSRFYHLLENLSKWEKPKLTGVALKPKPENISEYSKVSAPKVFDDLIMNLRVNYIVVTYNNTYDSKSSSSKNKIQHEEILETLNKVGTTKVFEIPYQYFNSGKTSFHNHKEFVFITKVGNYV